MQEKMLRSWALEKRKRHPLQILTLKSRHDAIYDDLSFGNTAEIALQAVDAFAQGQYDKVILVYNRFKNAATQLVTSEQFLPIVAEQNTAQQVSGDYIYEPSQAEIVNELLPKSLKMQLFKAVRDSLPVSTAPE